MEKDIFLIRHAEALKIKDTSKYFEMYGKTYLFML